jgi:hypothetical protein
MNRELINERLELLFIVLQFSRWNEYYARKQNTLSVGERIMINQERGALLHCFDYPNTALRPVSDRLEQKIQENWRMIAQTNFKPLNENELSTF